MNFDKIKSVPFHETWAIQDASKLQLMMRCPRRYFYRYVLGWSYDIPNIHLIFGSAWHEAMAHLLLNGYSNAEVLVAYEKFLTYYRQYFSEEDDEIYHPKTPKRALLALIAYANHYAGDEFEVVEHDGKKMVEIAGQISLTDDLELSFKMDSILRTSNGIISREHKTASSLWNWDEQWYLSPQVGTYHYVLDSLYPEDSVAGIQMNAVAFKRTKDNVKRDQLDPSRHFDFQRVNIFKTNDQMQLWYNNTIWWMQFIQLQFDSLAECSDSDDLLYCFPQNPTDCSSYGQTCPYSDFCRFWKNPLQNLDRMPIGMKVEFWNPLKQESQVKLNIER